MHTERMIDPPPPKKNNNNKETAKRTVSCIGVFVVMLIKI